MQNGCTWIYSNQSGGISKIQERESDLPFFCLNRNKTSPMKRSPREIKEAKKAYDKVVDHLISEDYAKTKEDADQIISGMSEDWYYMILQS